MDARNPLEASDITAMVKKPMDTVRKWPPYLLLDLPPGLRAELQAEAVLRDDSISDVVRRHLCNRYHLDCLRKSFRHQPTLQNPGPHLYLRLQPELKRCIQTEARERGVSMRTVILSALVSVYGEIAA